MMITETATVVAVCNDKITVSASVKTACGSCRASADCGTSAVAKAFSPRQQTFELVSPLSLTEGDQVTIGIPEVQLLWASCMVYVLPLVVLIGSAVLLTALSSFHELVVLALSSGITWLTFKWVSVQLRQHRSGRFDPVIVNKIIQHNPSGHL